MTTDDDSKKLSNCSFCSKSQNQVQRLFTGLGSVGICNECLRLCQEILDAHPPILHENTSTQSETTTTETPYSCSFCGKPHTQVQQMIAGPGNVHICGECIDLHRKFLEEQYVPLTPNPDQNISSPPETTMSNALHNCSFCDKSQDQVQRLVAGPSNCYICDECINLSRKTLEDEWVALIPEPDQHTSTQPETRTSNAMFNALHSCSFCGKSQEQVRCLIAGPGSVYICGECVGSCLEIIQEDKM